MKRILLAVALLVSTGAFAEPCSKISQINGLTEKQQQSMIIDCERQKLEVLKQSDTPQVAKKVDEAVQNIDAETLNKVAEIAKVAGQTVKAVAQELNVAINEFVKTPVGLLVAGLSIWYVAGDSIGGMISSVWMVIVALGFILVMPNLFRREAKRCMIDSYEMKEVKTIFGGTKFVSVPVLSQKTNRDSIEGLFVFQVLCYLVGFIMLYFAF